MSALLAALLGAVVGFGTACYLRLDVLPRWRGSVYGWRGVRR